ncbi:MAG: hypothetical protein ACI4KR_10205 [Ruminiclostridium sp.]
MNFNGLLNEVSTIGLNETDSAPVTCKPVRGANNFNKWLCPDIASYIAQPEELKTSPLDWLITELENRGFSIDEKTKADILEYLKTRVRGEEQ